MTEKANITLRSFRREDLPLMAGWIQKEHVKPYYPEEDGWLEEISENLDMNNWVFHFIVEKDGYPIGFAQ